MGLKAQHPREERTQCPNSHRRTLGSKNGLRIFSRRQDSQGGWRGQGTGLLTHMQLDLSQTAEERDLVLCPDSDRASEGSVVPSLTSAFSVSSTFCPLISRWITLWAWRWARPWDKRAGQISCSGVGGKEQDGGRRLTLSPFRVRQRYRPYPPTARVQAELSWVCVCVENALACSGMWEGWIGAPSLP